MGKYKSIPLKTFSRVLGKILHEAGRRVHHQQDVTTLANSLQKLGLGELHTCDVSGPLEAVAVRGVEGTQNWIGNAEGIRRRMAWFGGEMLRAISKGDGRRLVHLHVAQDLFISSEYRPEEEVFF